MITTEQAHNNLMNLIVNGRILINGMPLTFNEQSALLQSEQMLFEKASKLDAASALVAKREIPENGGKGKVVKIDEKRPEKGN